MAARHSNAHTFRKKNRHQTRDTAFDPCNLERIILSSHKVQTRSHLHRPPVLQDPCKVSPCLQQSIDVPKRRPPTGQQTTQLQKLRTLWWLRIHWIAGMKRTRSQHATCRYNQWTSMNSLRAPFEGEKVDTCCYFSICKQELQPPKARSWVNITNLYGALQSLPAQKHDQSTF